MSASLNQIKERIKLTKSIEKITQALKLTSSSKMKKMLKSFRQFRIFIDTIYESLDLLNMNVDTSKDSKEIIFVVTSEIGLCGAYNNHVWRTFTNYISDKKNYEVIHVGKKLANRLEKFKPTKLDVNLSHGVDFPDNILKINKSANDIYNGLVNKEISKVTVIGYKFKNQLVQEEKVFQILPIETSKFVKQNVVEAIEYSPSKEEIFKSIVPFYLSVSLRAAIFESSLCIEAMRNLAMDAASNNAKEFIENLTLEHNRARQALITQEIMEIVAGAEGE